MSSPSHDCGVRAYAKVLGISSRPSKDLDGSTPVADGSENSPSSSRLCSATGHCGVTGNNQSLLGPEIRVFGPPRDQQEDSEDGSKHSDVGLNGCWSHGARSVEETECDSYYSDSSYCEPQARRSCKSKHPPRSQIGEASGTCVIEGTQDRAGAKSDGSLDEDWLGSDSEDESIDDRKHRSKMKKWKQMAQGKFEEMVLDCIVNTDRIAANYKDICVSRQVIDRVERTTSLSLKRQQAFSVGVLCNHKVTGAILYGPPGTGKSLLAKAVAKASRFNMISISTAEVWQKCHGDDERMIQAIFRLARKMYPCIVFVDEADAMLGQRKKGERRHIKAMINQFLVEWDGLSTDTKAPFVLLATNRPTDLDPAVIRRAPEKIYMGKPDYSERLGIIKLLLKDENLAPDLKKERLAQMTEGYTGSDLKNVCVTAATICVSQQKHDTKDRLLELRHFYAALETMGPSLVSKTDAKEYADFGGKSGNN